MALIRSDEYKSAEKVLKYASAVKNYSEDVFGSLFESYELSSEDTKAFLKIAMTTSLAISCVALLTLSPILKAIVSVVALFVFLYPGCAIALKILLRVKESEFVPGFSFSLIPTGKDFLLWRIKILGRVSVGLGLIYGICEVVKFVSRDFICSLVSTILVMALERRVREP